MPEGRSAVLRESGSAASRHEQQCGGEMNATAVRTLRCVVERQITVRGEGEVTSVPADGVVRAFREVASAALAPTWLWFEDHPRALSVMLAQGRAFVTALREPGDVGEVAVEPAAA